jgi:hypothetical protein
LYNVGAKIERFEVAGRPILFYLSGMAEGQPLAFSYTLVAKYPLIVRSPGSSVYDYYNAKVRSSLAPQELVVR